MRIRKVAQNIKRRWVPENIDRHDHPGLGGQRLRELAYVHVECVEFHINEPQFQAVLL